MNVRKVFQDLYERFFCWREGEFEAFHGVFQFVDYCCKEIKHWIYIVIYILDGIISEKDL